MAGEPPRRFPSGDSQPLVELRLDPDELARRFGLAVAGEHDDLEAFQLAAIALPDGAQAWLYNYRGGPEAGTGVRVAAADVAQTRARLLAALCLTDADRLWVSPYVAHPEEKPAPRQGEGCRLPGRAPVVA